MIIMTLCLSLISYYEKKKDETIEPETLIQFEVCVCVCVCA